MVFVDTLQRSVGVAAPRTVVQRQSAVSTELLVLSSVHWTFAAPSLGML